MSPKDQYKEIPVRQIITKLLKTTDGIKIFLKRQRSERGEKDIVGIQKFSMRNNRG
jgi:hypothetical protein